MTSAPKPDLTDYDPGDILSLNALVQRECSKGYVGRFFGKFSRFGKDRLRGADLFREGEYRMVGVGISRAGAAWEADVNLRGTFRGKAEILSGGSLVTEPERSRGDEWSAEASVRHALRKDVSLSGSVRGLIVAKNGYSDGSSRHNGSKEKIALSVGCDRSFASGMAVGVSLKGFLMSEEAQSVPLFREERTSRGIALAFRIGVKLTVTRRRVSVSRPRETGRTRPFRKGRGALRSPPRGRFARRSVEPSPFPRPPAAGPSGRGSPQPCIRRTPSGAPP